MNNDNGKDAVSSDKRVSCMWNVKALCPHCFKLTSVTKSEYKEGIAYCTKCGTEFNIESGE